MIFILEWKGNIVNLVFYGFLKNYFWSKVIIVKMII